MATQGMTFADDAKSSMSMRVDDEPTEITNKMMMTGELSKTRAVMQNANTMADALDSEDMTFDMTM